MQSTVCQACGAKTKEGRLRCPRCGEVLNAAVPPASTGAGTSGVPALYASYRGPLVLAGTVLSVIVLFVVIASQREPVAQPVVAVAAPAKAVTVPAPTSAPARPDAGFLDAKTGGAAAYRAGDYVSALEQYKKAVSLNPNDGDALNNLGQLLARNGDAAAAIPHLRKAVQLYPSVWAYRFSLAHAHGSLGEWSQAADDYRQARDLCS